MNSPDPVQALKKKILIIDDDQAILDAMSMMLEMEGYDVVTTPDGEHIQKKIKENPDLLFLDIWMSGVDGRDICKAIKAETATKNIPVVMISASREVAQSALESGADDFIAKPFQMTELLGVISKHLPAN